MKYLLIVILLIALSSCSHWRWVMKHQDEVCSKCPQVNETTTEQTDTVVWGVVPPDTIIIASTETDTVYVDNIQYRIIKVAGETKVIIKEKRVPVQVEKYKELSSKGSVITVKEKYVPKWIYFLWGLSWIIAMIMGYLIRKLFWR